MPRYNPATIEPKWQKFWDQHKTFAADRLPTGEKRYVLDMFPYPSGDGLHVGHPEGYTATDIVCRYHRMRGRAVMHPMGYDAFGLPAEQHAKKTGTPPRETTEKNIANFRRQMKMLGFSYDWDRELATTDVGFFRWTQWIFLKLFNSWFDGDTQRGRPIEELPIPTDVAAAGEEAIRRYQDEHRLAYQIEAPVNWCPKLGTVLSNEEVQGGVSERGGHPVVRIPLRQWMLRITAYADRLLAGLDDVDWPSNIKLLQKNWIGRSTGAEVDFFIGDQATADGQPSGDEFDAWQASRAKAEFPVKPGDEVLRVYTTRPDTLFGATYMVIAPEHPLVDRLTVDSQVDAVAAYREQAARKSELDRTDLAKEKTGVFSGSYAIEPVDGVAVPIWIADYVMMGYGTGAIMAVPAHDERDFEFAEQFDIPIRAVVDPGDAVEPDQRQAILAGKQVFTGLGVSVNSAEYDGVATDDFKVEITDELVSLNVGRAAVNYKLRDWLFSRQHYWGEPFPILHELDADGVPTGLMQTVPEDELPVDIPKMNMPETSESPEPPLDQAPEDWLYPVIDGVRFKRETNTMPQWAGSCWYYLRYLDPENSERLVDPEIEQAWMPVDLYIGGAEHAVLHLLYARFWHLVLYDDGLVSTTEPFNRLICQGMILGEPEFTGYQDDAGAWVSARRVKPADDGTLLADGKTRVTSLTVAASDVEKEGDTFVLKANRKITIGSRAHKMSKSRGNVVNPDVVVKEYGADALRLYEMFMGPLEATKPWSMSGVNGVRGFLDRAWRMIVDDRAESLTPSAAIVEVAPDDEQNRVLHRTIKAVTQDIESMSFNTAISRMMEFTNSFTKQSERPRAAMEALVLLLAPFAPHIAEELWQVLGHEDTLAYAPWPEWDEAALVEQSVELPAQINGKVRSRITVPTDVDRDALEAAARADARITELLAGKTVVKVIVVPGRLVNFVVK